MATATKMAKGFGVTCPLCHDSDAVVSIDLNKVEECSCSGCSETYSAVQARDLAVAELIKWEKVARWVAMYPDAMLD